MVIGADRAPFRGRAQYAWSEYDSGAASNDEREALMPGDTDLFEIMQIMQAGACAPNGGNTQRWRFLVIKDTKIKQAVQVYYKRAFDEVVGPRYLKSAPPPGVSREQYNRQHAAVEYLTNHFHEAPVWIVACIENPHADVQGTAASTR